jgi:hypothetical protein
VKEEQMAAVHRNELEGAVAAVAKQSQRAEQYKQASGAARAWAVCALQGGWRRSWAPGSRGVGGAGERLCVCRLRPVQEKERLQQELAALGRELDSRNARLDQLNVRPLAAGAGLWSRRQRLRGACPCGYACLALCVSVSHPLWLTCFPRQGVLGEAARIIDFARKPPDSTRTSLALG